ncbi:MAG TPA: MASE1 domain-containing protein [Candidatus Polarisedimenticolia bacterium]|nr:MASE1 domain-containing protein [Candidatus Polarisedimenticolia bacterium]
MNRSFVKILAVAAIYFLAARLGLLLAFERTNASPVWPPSGIAFAAVLLAGRGVWPGILLGAFAANLSVFFQNHAATPLTLTLVSAGIAAGNTLEALAGWWILRRFGGEEGPFARVEGVFLFLGTAAVMCATAATAGALALSAAGIGQHVPAFLIWLTWWLGDVTGVLLLTPLLMVWSSPPRFPRSGRLLESAALAALVAGTALVGFGAERVIGARYPFAFLTIPAIIWAAVRFGARGATAALAAVSAIAVVHTVQGLGPFSFGTINTSLLLVQAYVGVLTATHLTLAAALAERAAAQGALEAARQALEGRVAERTAVASHQAVQLRALAAELVRTEQRERQQLSRVLHDHVQQLLVAAKLQIAKRRRAARPEQADEASAQADELISRSILALRELTVQLSPPILLDGGLPAGAEWLAREMKLRHDVDVHLRAEACEGLDDATAVFAFESLREALFNVVKHSGRREAWVSLRREAPGFLVVEVRDQGCGFPSAAVEKPPGEGLGLFGVAERARMLGGHLAVESPDGGGALVRLSIPLGLGREAPHRPGPAPWPRQRVEAGPVPASATRVLIADDHALFRQGLASLLEQEAGIVVVGQAANGAEAVDLARELRPDVVVLDVGMPVMGGIEAARLIRASLPSVRIIGLSMYEEGEMKDVMLAAGAEAYLSKDHAAEELSRLLRPRPVSP